LHYKFLARAVTDLLWYDAKMPRKKHGTPPKKVNRKQKAEVVIGARRFAKISAVKGIVLTHEMQTRAAEFNRKGMSADERRQSIMRVYRKA
jgi:hypothetical protein